MTSPDGSEQRKHKRVPFIQDIQVVGVGPLRSSDISLGGMYLDTVNEFSVGSLITIRFKLLETDPEPAELQARVTYTHPSVGVGLSFHEPPPEILDRIRALIEGS